MLNLSHNVCYIPDLGRIGRIGSIKHIFRRCLFIDFFEFFLLDNHVKWYDKYQLVTMDGSWHGNEDYEGHSNETALQNYEMLLSQLIVMLDHIAEDGVAIIRAKMKYASGAVVLTLLSRMFESVEPVKLDRETCGSLWHSIFSYVICQQFKSQSRDENLKIINEFLGEIKEGSTFFLEVSESF